MIPAETIDRARTLRSGGATLREASRAVGMHFSTISRKLRTDGFDCRKNGVSRPKYDHRRALEMLRNGVSVRDVGRMLGAAKCTVHGLATRHGLTPGLHTRHGIDPARLEAARRALVAGLDEKGLADDLGLTMHGLRRLVGDRDDVKYWRSEGLWR